MDTKSRTLPSNTNNPCTKPIIVIGFPLPNIAKTLDNPNNPAIANKKYKINRIFLLQINQLNLSIIKMLGFKEIQLTDNRTLLASKKSYGVVELINLDSINNFARLEGVEPPTVGSEDQCSIH